MCPKELGGLNIPNLKKYYWAAQLRSMIAWVCQDEDTIWFKMEQGDCQDTFLDTMPFVNQDTCSKNKINNDWVKPTLSIWSTIKKTLNLPSSLCRVIRINNNTEFIHASG